MAATIEARRLTEAHRLAQARLGAQTVAAVLAAWPLLDLDNLDGSLAGWLRVVAPVVQAQRRTSARLAANYLTTFRALELGVDVGPIVPTLAETVDTKTLTTSLLVTGPVAVKAALARRVTLAQAADIARSRSSAAAMRHALGGGRDTIAGTVGGDRRALGWARATSGKTCHFCAMLAGRGPVYSEQTVGFEAHDGCACTAEPVYRRDSVWPAGSQRYRDLWNEATQGLSGDDAVNAFRQSLAS